MICRKCSAENPDEAKYCMNCGRSINETACPECDALIPEGSKFCILCGAKTASDKTFKTGGNEPGNHTSQIYTGNPADYDSTINAKVNKGMSKTADKHDLKEGIQSEYDNGDIYTECKKCGYHLEPNKKFCGKCGYAIGGVEEYNAVKDSHHRVGTENHPPMNNKHRTLTVFRLIAVPVAALLVLVLAVYTASHIKRVYFPRGNTSASANSNLTNPTDISNSSDSISNSSVKSDKGTQKYDEYELGYLEAEFNGQNKKFYTNGFTKLSNSGYWFSYCGLDKKYMQFVKKQCFDIQLPGEVKNGDSFVISEEMAEAAGLNWLFVQGVTYFDMDGHEYLGGEGGSTYLTNGLTPYKSSYFEITINSWGDVGSFAEGTISGEFVINDNEKITLKNGYFKIKIIKG